MVSARRCTWLCGQSPREPLRRLHQPGALPWLGTGWILGVIQATGLVVLLRFVVGIEAANLIGTLVFAILVSATIMAINRLQPELVT